jgi:hypothetical protein
MSAHRAALALFAVVLAACSRGAAPAPSPTPAAAGPGRPLPSPIPEVVARVNGQPIRIRQILPMAKAEFDALPAEEQERQKAEVLRHALEKYVERELLLQEALARGVQADSGEVERAYDQMRRDHREDRDWADFLARQGMDPQSLRAELRARYTVEALLDQEAALRPGEPQGALVERLRAKARIELLL